MTAARALTMRDFVVRQILLRDDATRASLLVDLGVAQSLVCGNKIATQAGARAVKAALGAVLDGLCADGVILKFTKPMHSGVVFWCVASSDIAKSYLKKRQFQFRDVLANRAAAAAAKIEAGRTLSEYGKTTPAQSPMRDARPLFDGRGLRVDALRSLSARCVSLTFAVPVIGARSAS